MSKRGSIIRILEATSEAGRNPGLGRSLTLEQRRAVALQIARGITAWMISNKYFGPERFGLLSADAVLSEIEAGNICFDDVCDSNMFIHEALSKAKLIPRDASRVVRSARHMATWNSIVSELQWAAGELLRARRGEIPISFCEHDGIEFPVWLRELGFEDEAWHNDSGARATLRSAEDKEESVTLPGGEVHTFSTYQFPVMFCWCDAANKAKREMQDGSPRYYCFVARNDEEFNSNSGELIYEGEDGAACEAAINKWLSEHPGFVPYVREI